MTRQLTKASIRFAWRRRQTIMLFAAVATLAAIFQWNTGSVRLTASEHQNVTCRLLNIKQQPALAVSGSEDGSWIALDMGPETGLYSTKQQKVVGSWPLGSKLHSFVKPLFRNPNNSTASKSPSNANDYLALVITLKHVEVWRLQPFERIAAVERSGTQRQREHEQPKIAINSGGSLLAVEDETGPLHSKREPKVRVFSIRDNPFGSTPQFEVEPPKSIPESVPVGHVEFIGNRLLVKRFQPLKTGIWSFFYSADSGELVKAFPKNRDVIGSTNGQYFLTTILKPHYPYSQIAKESPVFTVHDTVTGDELASAPLESLPRDVAFHPAQPRVAIALGRTLKEFDFKRNTMVFEQQAVDCEYAHVRYGFTSDRLYALEERPTGVDDDVDCKLVAWETGSRSAIEFPNDSLQHLRDFGDLFFADAEQSYILNKDGNQRVQMFEIKDMQTGASLRAPISFQAAQKEVQYSTDEDYLELESVRLHLQTKRLEVKQSSKSNIENLFPGLFPIIATCSPDAARWLVVPQVASDSSPDQLSANSVLLIDAVSGNPVASHSRFRVQSAAFVSNRVYVLSGLDGIELRDSSTGEVQHADRRVLGQSLTISISGNATGQILVGGANTIRQYPVERPASEPGWSSVIDSKSLARFDMLHPSAATCSAWNRDATRFAIGHLNGSLEVYNAETKQKTHQISGIRGQVFAVTFDPSGLFLLSASESGLGVAALDSVADQELFAKQLEVALNSSRLNDQELNVRVASNGMNGKQVPGLTRLEIGDLNADWDSARVKQRASRRITLPPLTNRYASYGEPHVSSVLGDVQLFDETAPPVLVDDRNQTIMDLRAELPSTLVEMRSSLSSNGKRLLFASAFSRSPGGADGELRLFDVERKRELARCNFACPAGLITAEPHPLENIVLLRMQDGICCLINAHDGTSLGTFKMKPYSSTGCLFVDQGKKILGYSRLQESLFLRGTHSLDLSSEIRVDLPIEWVLPLPDDQHVLIGQQYLYGVAYVTKYNVEKGSKVWSHAGLIAGNGLFARNGRWYLSKALDQWSLWDLDTPQEKLNIQFPNAMGIANASLDDDGTIRLKHDNSVLWSPERAVVENSHQPKPVEKASKTEHIAGRATLKIRVVYRGEVPRLPPLNAASDPSCAHVAIPNEKLIVGKEGAIQNAALIWDERRNSKFKPFDEDQNWRDEIVELKCIDCRFEPHVLVMRAGQKVKINIQDRTTHSPNISFLNNTPPSVLLPAGKSQTMQVVQSEPAPLPIECNVHPWMRAYLIVQEHPYIGVSNTDGKIEIDNLPTGENVFRLWHEAFAGPIDKVVINGVEQAITKGTITFQLVNGRNDMGTVELQDSQFEISTDQK